jgi:tetratricopeptide (TPR) repeat protein
LRQNTAENVEALIDKAWEAPSPAKRAGFARTALVLDPKAIDAYVALALCVATWAERIALLREAVRLGELRWQEQSKPPFDGFFWGDVETRPFMRAMHNLALVLWDIGDRTEAASLADKLLRLNPGDNQGIRYLALAWNAVLGNWARVKALLNKYRGDGGADYLYARCLYCIHRGAGAEAALKAAATVNPHVPALLLTRAPPKRASESGYVAYGSEEEAAAYVEFARDAWLAVPQALGWLRAAWQKLAEPARRPRRYHFTTVRKA